MSLIPRRMPGPQVRPRERRRQPPCSDGATSSSTGRTRPAAKPNAFEQAIALKPDGIIIGSLAATQFKSLFKRASDQGIKMVSWHSAAAPGPIEDVPEVFWNLSTDPYRLANIAAKYAVTHSNAGANAVILTDPQFAIVNTKTKGEKDGIEACEGCRVLSVENAPYTQISQRMPSLMSALLQRYGGQARLRARVQRPLLRLFRAHAASGRRAPGRQSPPDLRRRRQRLGL